MEDNKEKTQAELIAELRAEYDKKFAEEKANHQREMEEKEKTYRESLKAIISGREEPKEEIKEKKKSFFDVAVEETKNKLHIK